MIKKSFEFFLVYLKITVREGVISLAWGQIVPILTFITLNLKWFYIKPDFNHALPVYSAFWSLLIVNLFIYGVGIRTSIFRETGFLRQFIYIAGSKTPIIVGLLFIQIVYGILLLFIFNILTSMIFQYNLISLISISYLTLIATAIPLFMLVIVLPTLSVSSNDLYSITNMLVFPSTFITMFRGEFGDFWLNFLFALNPIEYVYKFSLIIASKLNGLLIPDYNYVTVASVTFIFLIIGLVSWSRIKINSTVVRT
jgi:ABC-2 type transport system permease protein